MCRTLATCSIRSTKNRGVSTALSAWKSHHTWLMTQKERWQRHDGLREKLIDQTCSSKFQVLRQASPQSKKCSMKGSISTSLCCSQFPITRVLQKPISGHWNGGWKKVTGSIASLR